MNIRKHSAKNPGGTVGPGDKLWKAQIAAILEHKHVVWEVGCADTYQILNDLYNCR